MHEFDYDHESGYVSVMGYEPIQGSFSVKIITKISLFHAAIHNAPDGPFAVFACGSSRPNSGIMEPGFTLIATILSRLPYIPQLPPRLQRLIEPNLGHMKLRPGIEQGYMIVDTHPATN